MNEYFRKSLIISTSNKFKMFLRKNGKRFDLSVVKLIISRIILHVNGKIDVRL